MIEVLILVKVRYLMVEIAILFNLISKNGF